MSSIEIEQNVKHIFENFTQENFLYDFLLAYGIPKSSVTRLKSGDFNLSKEKGEVLYKKKVFFKEAQTDSLLSTIESLSKEERILKHMPRFAIVTDYKNLVAKDLKLGNSLPLAIAFNDLPKHYGFFLPLANSEFNKHNNNDTEADRNAAYKMATLYDELVTKNQDIYNCKESIHHLNIFLSRLLFCYFAEDTEIFERNGVFTDTLFQHTDPNGSDTHLFLDRLFDRLSSENAKNFPAHFVQFPYVNGGLFKDPIASPIFTAKARKILVELGELNWQEINPDIFGSMIQAVVMPEYRSDLGMHYTSVPNIMKLIKPLFLDELYETFENNKHNAKALDRLLVRLSKIKLFDPACGSGNFLIIAYKELRVLEIKIIQQLIELTHQQALYPSVQTKLKVVGENIIATIPPVQGRLNFGAQQRIYFSEISLTQFYGIEIDDFAHEMAILSLWLVEHQMNKYFEQELAGYAKYQSILPLKPSGNIVQGNAARVDWKTVCPINTDDEVYIIGNPPYLGKSLQVEEQKRDMDFVFSSFSGYKNLDYISIWFYKGAKYIEGYNAHLAFVSTNSICQGEQVALLWTKILNPKIEIAFAHLSFKWTNNAKGNAGVTVIILGLRNISNLPKFLFTDRTQEAKNINAYLLDATNVIVSGLSNSISGFSEMTSGSKISDDGNLLLSERDRELLMIANSTIAPFIKKFIGAHEFINGNLRFCIHITSQTKEEACKIKELADRFEKVKKFREKSTKAATKKKAATPYFFDEDKHRDTECIIVPRHSSENREYIPIGFLDENTVIADSALAIYDAEPYLFAVVNSKMHMVWVRAVGGKLKTDYRYSAKLCYNTFPFPDISLKQKETLNLYVFAILDERAKHPEKTMAQLYDPDKMPAGLRQAHTELDRAVEQCYRLQPFTSDTERLEYLFKLYEEMTQRGTLFEKQKKTRKKK